MPGHFQKPRLGPRCHLPYLPYQRQKATDAPNLEQEEEEDTPEA